MGYIQFITEHEKLSCFPSKPFPLFVLDIPTLVKKQISGNTGKKCARRVSNYKAEILKIYVPGIVPYMPFRAAATCFFEVARIGFNAFFRKAMVIACDSSQSTIIFPIAVCSIY